MSQLLRRLTDCESGATAVEYGLIVALIALTTLVAFQALGVSVGALYEIPKEGLTNATTYALQNGG